MSPGAARTYPSLRPYPRSIQRAAKAAAILFAEMATLPAQTAAPGDPSIIRTSTRLVSVSVLVLDRNGKPIEGLQPRDFVVLDNGKPQPDVRLFQRGSTVLDPASVDTTTRAATASRMRLPYPLPPGIY